MLQSLGKIVACVLICISSIACADNVDSQQKKTDTIIKDAMKKFHVPAVSIAMIDNNKIIYLRAYSQNKKTKSTTDSLYQVGTISNSVASLAALKLAEQKSLSLDADVNQYLNSWKLPDSKFTHDQKVTVRRILSMTSGLNVENFEGYPAKKPLPTLSQILEGEEPAINPAVRVISQPGSNYQYSVGGYAVLEQMIGNISHSSFADYTTNHVLKPLGMTSSYFDTQLPSTAKSTALPGYYLSQSRVEGNWHHYPVLAANGMWSTPKDIANMVIELMRSFHGSQGAFINSDDAAQLFTRQENSDHGLGFALDGCKKSLNFRKSGHTLGYYSQLLAFPETGQGIVIMTNSNNGAALIQEVVSQMGWLYHWPNHYALVDESYSIPLLDNCKDLSWYQSHRPAKGLSEKELAALMATHTTPVSPWRLHH